MRRQCDVARASSDGGVELKTYVIGWASPAVVAGGDMARRRAREWRITEAFNGLTFEIARAVEVVNKQFYVRWTRVWRRVWGNARECASDERYGTTSTRGKSARGAGFAGEKAYRDDASRR